MPVTLWSLIATSLSSATYGASEILLPSLFTLGQQGSKEEISKDLRNLLMLTTPRATATVLWSPTSGEEVQLLMPGFYFLVTKGLISADISILTYNGGAHSIRSHINSVWDSSDPSHKALVSRGNSSHPFLLWQFEPYIQPDKSDRPLQWIANAPSSIVEDARPVVVVGQQVSTIYTKRWFTAKVTAAVPKEGKIKVKVERVPKDTNGTRLISAVLRRSLNDLVLHPPILLASLFGVIGDHLYQVGGMPEPEFPKDGVLHVWRLDLVTRAWNSVRLLGSAPTQRFQHAGAVIKGDLWLHGGAQTGTTFSDLWRFTASKKRWVEIQQKGDVPGTARRHSMAVLGEIIYMFGGLIRGKLSNTLWSLATKTGVWTLMYSTNSAQSSAIVDVTAGGNNLSVTQDNAPCPRVDMTLMMNQNNLFVYGGRSTVGPLGDLWVYNVHAGKGTKWKEILVNLPLKGRFERSILPSWKVAKAAMIRDRILILAQDMAKLTPVLYEIMLQPAKSIAESSVETLINAADENEKALKQISDKFAALPEGPSASDYQKIVDLNENIEKLKLEHKRLKSLQAKLKDDHEKEKVEEARLQGLQKRLEEQRTTRPGFKGSASRADLQSLISVEIVDGSVRIIDQGDLVDLSFLGSLRNVTGDFVILRCGGMISLKGMEFLEYVGGAIIIENNPKLVELDSFHSLKTVAGLIKISHNKNLQSIDGMTQVTSAAGIVVVGNPKLGCPANPFKFPVSKELKEALQCSIDD